MCRRTYFVIRRDIPSLRREPPPPFPLLRSRPTLSEGGSPYRESDELLLRRYSCISMTHRFARDLSFNGVSRSFFLFTYPPLRAPLCSGVSLIPAISGRFSGGGGEGRAVRWKISDTWTRRFVRIVRSDVCERKIGDLGVSFFLRVIYLHVRQANGYDFTTKDFPKQLLETRVPM